MRRYCTIQRAGLALLAVFAPIALGGCSPETMPAEANPPRTITSKKTFRIIPEPAYGASAVTPIQPIRLSVTAGKLNSIKLTNESGKEVAGTLAKNKRIWNATEPLGFAKVYTWSGKATDDAGEQYPIKGSFRTVTPDRLVSTRLNVVPNSVHSPDVPIILTFGTKVENKTNVENALRVQADPETAGEWAWSDDDTAIEWRPRKGWKPGTTVKVDAKLYGVQTDDGHYTFEDLDISFRIRQA